MSTPTAQLIRVEHVDDLPVLWATLSRLNLPQLLDRFYPTHPLWAGDLSFGEVLSVWLAFLLSQGDHRLNRLQPWVEAHLLTLQTLLGKPVRPLDFHDDRLADLLSALPQAETWIDFETHLNQHTVRVYDLKPSQFRLDSTTANSHADVVSEHGLLPFGHSKDRADLPQLKIAVAALDPLGMPVSTLVVPGHCADDPLYLPQIQQVQQAFGKGGKTYISDCKGSALAIRAYLASTNDYYLSPLSEKQFSRKQRREQIQRVQRGEQALQPVYRPTEKPAETPELVAEGFVLETPLEALVQGRSISWSERRWLVRSVAFAESQQKHLEERVPRAEEELQQLGERKQGKRVLSASQMQEAASALLVKHRVEGLVRAEVQTKRQEQIRRRYGNRPEQVVVGETHRGETQRQEEAIQEAKAELGWQVYASNNPTLPLAGVVWSYRGQYQIEKGWSRLKGKPLSLTPIYLADEERILGLVLLLSLALRVLTLLQGTVRRKLQESGESLQGIYAGQSGRKTKSPSAELLLEAFRGISLSVLEIAGERIVLLTGLSELQRRLLALWDWPADLYQRLAANHIAEPPTAMSER